MTLSVWSKAAGLCFPEVFFFILRFPVRTENVREEFIDKFEKDNEVKKNKKQIDQ